MTANASDSPAPHAFTRRTALKLAAVAVAGGALGAGGAAIITQNRPRVTHPFKYFTSDEAKLLTAVCEEIIPRDDAPGATDLGVIHFMDRQLAGKLARHAPKYRHGLAALQDTCRAEFKRTFEELGPEQKVEVLRRLEAGTVPKELWREPAPAPREFFRLVLGHTMQGFYGPSRHGGNRDHGSYRMLGLAYPQIIGQNRQSKEGV